ncbi:MAG: indolepyruvate ferredoxin oxidoreductase [Bacteroidales bacterium]|jgi:indolepyruvate ferredoxin oxidoreductase alpha subunit|nr:indolepyruvate ferredoxin oxidoreductase [Bacteroidales bacterium]
MDKLLLLGDEAIAQGAIDAGLSGVFAYPGTPSTEITEYIQDSKEAHQKSIRSNWACNEKTAMEAALGMSYAGKRAMFCCKHVGINMAADPFLNSSITGANGGLIYVAADDPSMHSSQDEQDSRFYGDFAFLPILEPSSQQEAYDMVHYGFDMSEKFGLPVLMRITTRMAHSRAAVVRKSSSREQNKMKIPEDRNQFILLPVNARRQYKELLAKQDGLRKASEDSVFNQYIDADNKKMGIIACGIAYNYLMENFSGSKCPYPVLKLSQYPVPESLVEKMYNECESILVLEEGQPLIERLLRGLLNKGKKIMGRLDDRLERTGELSPNMVGKALQLNIAEGLDVPSFVAPRPPKLCDGCPHIDSFLALNEAIEPYGKGKVLSDIGCYTLAALPPYNAIYSTVDMGASITMAKGAAEAGLNPAVGVIGDSTFTHSGMTGLLDCCVDNVPITIMILDNDITGMTGSQKSSATGRIESICKGIGVDEAHIRVITPLKKNHQENVDIIKQELAYQGVSVIIPRRECLVWAAKKRKMAKNNQN